MAGAYRDATLPLAGRLRELRSRVAELDADMPASKRRRLPAGLQRELAELRRASEPGDDSMRAMLEAERAVELYEKRLDEALGLAAELRRSVEPVLPRKEVVAKWSGLFALSVLLLVTAVQQMGLGDFMLRAFGVSVERASAEIPVSRILHQAHALDTSPAPARTAATGETEELQRLRVVPSRDGARHARATVNRP